MTQRFGYMAFFESPEALVQAVRGVRQAGYRAIQAYTPFAVDALEEALDLPPTRVPLATFIGGMVGGVGMLVMQYIAAVINYPLRIGGRPFASWPAFIPPALEITFLTAALAMLIGNRLPAFYHPVFNVDRFERASQDAFVLVVRSGDKDQAGERLRVLLKDLHATQVEEVCA